VERGYQVIRRGEQWELTLPDGGTIDPAIALVHERGLRLRLLVEKRQSLEDLFIETVEEAEPGVDHVPDLRQRPGRAARPVGEFGRRPGPRRADDDRVQPGGGRA
jgi:ABC-2 type transport system ATP-binding protein